MWKAFISNHYLAVEWTDVALCPRTMLLLTEARQTESSTVFSITIALFPTAFRIELGVETPRLLGTLNTLALGPGAQSGATTTPGL